jgi:hypothetical protein
MVSVIASEKAKLHAGNSSAKFCASMRSLLLPSSGECRDGVETHGVCSTSGSSVSSPAAGRRLGLSGSGWSAVEGAACVWAAGELSSGFASTGAPGIQPWSANWSATCPIFCISSPSRVTCGEAAHHQRDRAVFRGGPATHRTNGGIHERGETSIIYAIFSRFNEDSKNHTLELFTQAA